jgi:hypothetical protein
MDKRDILPPGRHPRDSSKPHVDQVAYALGRLQTFLKWIDEHRASFEIDRDTDPDRAEAELFNLKDSTEQAVLYLSRLTELLLAGNTIDPNKVAPKELCNASWVCWVNLLLQERRF